MWFSAPVTFLFTIPFNSYWLCGVLDWIGANKSFDTADGGQVMKSPSTVTISDSTVVDIAKQCLVEFNCSQFYGRVACPAVLYSWSTLRKHLLQHCSAHFKNGYHCTLKQCSAPVHATMKELHKHIDSSHLGRINLPCPFRACPVTHLRPADVLGHFQKHHAAVNGRTITLPSNILHPLSAMYAPCPKRPHPLPPDPVPPGTAILTVTRLRPKVIRPRYKIQTPVPEPSQSRGLLATPTSISKRTLRASKTKRLLVSSEGSQPPPSVRLKDLNHSFPQDATDIPIFVWKPPEWAIGDNIGPARMPSDLSGLDTIPPTSIFYPAFIARVAELERTGKLDSAEPYKT